MKKQKQLTFSRRGFLRYSGMFGLAATGALTGFGRRNLAYAKKDSVKIAVPFRFMGLDPHAEYASFEEESLKNSVFDRFLYQDRDLILQPHVLEQWEWGPNKMTMDIKIRKGIQFHNGDNLDSKDITFTFDRMRSKECRYNFIWKIVNKIDVKDRYNLRLHFARFDPSFEAWLSFLTSFVIPKDYFTRVGKQGFREKPIGSGPYKVVRFIPGNLLVLEAFKDYFKGPPAIERVTFKILLDANSRVSEILSGDSDLTAEVPFEQFDRITSEPNLKGVRQPITAVFTFFVNSKFPLFQDKRARLAIHHAIDKESIVKHVLLGFGRPVSMTEVPLYAAYDPKFHFPYDPDKARQLLSEAGYSKSNPLKFKMQTTKGWKAKDYEMVLACTQMWKDVGIEVEVEVITPAQWSAYRGTGSLAPLSTNYWTNPTRDPINSVGYQLWGPGPFNIWESPDMDDKLKPVFTEKDENKRIAAGKEAARYAVEQGYIIPVIQAVEPIIMKKDLQFIPYPQGSILPQDMSWA